jgi:GMP synthase (glutamine-hydrolysing)
LFRNLPDNLTVFHWHGETFDIPKGAELIASSEGCRNQLFTSNNNRVIGFQCHLETNKESLKAISDNCKNEIIQGKYIQTVAQMEEGVNKYTGEMHKALFSILESLI